MAIDCFSGLTSFVTSLPSAQFQQQANFNPFQAAAAGTSGPSTNPFPQFQGQPQPTGVLQLQFTAVPGATQQLPNPFPTSPNALQSQMTGVNPFRASTLPMQATATGLSPFGQTNPPPPVPMVPNPFPAQNGSLGTNPFPTSLNMHPTNPFPGAGQSTNPFPTAANVNPFAVPTNHSAPSVTSPNQFTSPNPNPFPTQSPTVTQPFSYFPPSQSPFTNQSNPIIPAQTSTLTGPASGPVPRPASTPLTHRKLSSPPPQPLKSHQTGSRNPFGVPRAPSPPPLPPRAPTLFELANGPPQSQPQTQSPVQVKPQQTGFPTTTFSSVASTFIASGAGSAQAPQPTTSSFTLGSSNTSASTPTTTATGSTFSDSLISSFGVQPTGSTALSSQLTGAPLRPQATGFNAGVKAFKPTSSFGASLLEALPPIPQSEQTTPGPDATSAAASPPAWTTGTNGISAPRGLGLGASLGGVTSPTTGLGAGTSGAAGFGADLSGVSSPTTGVGTTGFGGSFGLSAQPTSSPTANTGLGGPTTLGVGLRPQATGFGAGVGAANPFRASMMTPGMGPAGTVPPFNPANFNAGHNLFSQPTGVPSFGQSLFVGAQADASKQQNGTASLI